MTQREAYSEFFPLIQDTGKDYQKFSLIYARIATDKEYIETYTADGLETTNYAKLGDFVVKNLQTEYQEEYIVSREMFFQRYRLFYWQESGCVCIPNGRVKAAIYSGDEIEFLAAWGRYMILKPGDFIVTPLPDMDEVYRIAAQEFFETYELME